MLRRHSDRSKRDDGAHLAYAPAGQADRHAGREHDDCRRRDQPGDRRLRRQRVRSRHVRNHHRTLDDNRQCNELKKCGGKIFRQPWRQRAGRHAAVTEQGAACRRREQPGHDFDQRSAAVLLVEIHPSKHEIGAAQSEQSGDDRSNETLAGREHDDRSEWHRRPRHHEAATDELSGNLEKDRADQASCAYRRHRLPKRYAVADLAPTTWKRHDAASAFATRLRKITARASDEMRPASLNTSERPLLSPTTTMAPTSRRSEIGHLAVCAFLSSRRGRPCVHSAWSGVVASAVVILDAAWFLVVLGCWRSDPNDRITTRMTCSRLADAPACCPSSLPDQLFPTFSRK